MGQREELAKLICEATQKTNYSCTMKCKRDGSCAYCQVIVEHLIENGVFVLPFAAGDEVYFTHHISDAIPDFTSSDVVTKIGFATRGIMHEQAYDIHQIGKTVFLTEDAAKNAIKECEE